MNHFCAGNVLPRQKTQPSIPPPDPVPFQNESNPLRAPIANSDQDEHQPAHYKPRRKQQVPPRKRTQQKRRSSGNHQTHSSHSRRLQQARDSLTRNDDHTRFLSGSLGPRYSRLSSTLVTFV